MFKFNFNVEENNTNECVNSKENDNDADDNDRDNVDVSSPVCGHFYINDLPNEIHSNEEDSRKKFDTYESDLVPDIYEGGFKTWECSHDLVDYLKTIIDNFCVTTNVLEIGCGSGLPGLELNKYTQFNVDFQDFNREVVEQTARSIRKDQNNYNNRMFFGDWGDLVNIIPSKHYDLILSSETIYCVRNYAKLVKLFDHALKSDGTIYLAAKIYYFGVQGGVRQFEQFIAATGLFNTRVIRIIDANVKREILEIKRSTGA